MVSTCRKALHGFMLSYYMSHSVTVSHISGSRLANYIPYILCLHKGAGSWLIGKDSRQYYHVSRL